MNERPMEHSIHRFTEKTGYTNMFGSQGGLSSSSGSGFNLVEISAGRMNLSGKMLHRDTRKELGDDGLMHFRWKDRTSGKACRLFFKNFDKTAVQQQQKQQVKPKSVKQ